MTIGFLGTSAGWPLSRLGCRCEICSSSNPKDKRTRSQALINGQLLLDIGPDTYFHLSQKNIDPTKITHAAITHEHPDHTFGLWDLGHVYHGKKIKVIVVEATYKKIRNLFFYKEYEILKVREGDRVDIDRLKVSLLPVNHTRDSSFGILVEEKDKRLFWAPDFKSLPASTKQVLKNIDLIAMDGSELKIPTKSHQTIEEGIDLGKELRAKRVYFIHLGHRTLPHSELEKLVKKRGEQFHISHDGLELAL